jgi:hypothetical protein
VILQFKIKKQYYKLHNSHQPEPCISVQLAPTKKLSDHPFTPRHRGRRMSEGGWRQQGVCSFLLFFPSFDVVFSQHDAMEFNRPLIRYLDS